VQIIALEAQTSKPPTITSCAEEQIESAAAASPAHMQIQPEYEPTCRQEQGATADGLRMSLMHEQLFPMTKLHPSPQTRALGQTGSQLAMGPQAPPERQAIIEQS